MIFQKRGSKFIFNPVKKYFNKISQKEKYIALILDDLQTQKDILKRDNITLEIEINGLSEIIEELEEEYKNGQQLIEKVNSEIEEIKRQSEDMANTYENNILVPLEKKVFDIKQTIIVKKQSIVALEIIRRNNKEIIRNIERISNVTIVALNTSVIVAKSLYNQKIILNKLNGMKSLTENIIDTTGKNLSNEGGKIYNDLTNDNLTEKLVKAFNNVLDTISETNSKNQKSLPENEKQIIELRNIDNK